MQKCLGLEKCRVPPGAPERTFSGPSESGQMPSEQATGKPGFASVGDFSVCFLGQEG